MQKINVNIAGQSLRLKGDIRKEEAEAIAEFVDQKISEALSQNKKIGMSLATLLSAVNIAGELFITKKELLDLREISKEPMENYERVKQELKSGTFEKNNLNDEISRLKDELVSSLNTIGDMNKLMIQAKEKKKTAEKLLDENRKQYKEIQKNITELQEKVIELSKENAEFKKAAIYNKGLKDG